MSGERKSWRRIMRHDPSEDLRAELEHHIEERVRDHVARGLSPDEARRAVEARLGDLTAVREECEGLATSTQRADERRRSLMVSWLDVKLGLRMLVKHPGLTVVGGIGMAVAIAIGASVFGIIWSMLDPALPLEEGDRVVKIQAWDAASGQTEALALHDYVDLRGTLSSIVNVGAYRRGMRNVIGQDGRVEPFRVTEMSAAGFDVARVPAQIGRTLLPEDERAGAPPVVVIGNDVWRNRFASDAGIIGGAVRLGDVVHTIVGVMPPGFAFPENDRFWTALRLDPSAWDRGDGPRVEVFGRLAEGASLRAAQAELMTVGERLGALRPATVEPFRLRLQPYTHAFVEPDVPTLGWVFHFIQVMISLLLVVVCVNVAILTYARTVTRLSEIAVRNALGASRTRIISQLFVESAVLSGVSAVIGVGVAWATLHQLNLMLRGMVGDELPFWFDFRLSGGAILYVAGLIVLAALITGVVPALKATGRRVSPRLQQLSGASNGIRLGRGWTGLVIMQVAVAVGALPVAVAVVWNSVKEGGADPGYAAPAFISASLQLDREVPRSNEADDYERAYGARYASLQTELMRRIEGDPAVSDVTFALRAPGWEHLDRIEFEGSPSRAADAADAADAAGYRVGVGRVDPDYLAAFEVPLLAGRTFVPGDLLASSNAIVVNESFVERIGAGANVLGRRIRYVRGGADEGAWYEIVGVVADFPSRVDPDMAEARLYHPIAPGDHYPVGLAIRVREGDAAGFATRLRTIAAAVDPGLRFDDIRPMVELNREERSFNRLFAAALAAITLSVLLLSAAGIHALMSFTVARRRREIGIRAALGADPRDVLRGIFTRAAGQLSIGVVAGLILAVAFFWVASEGKIDGGLFAGSFGSVAVIVVITGLLAVLGPARRGLRIEPTEALRGD